MADMLRDIRLCFVRSL